jgi:hypothetical protein
VSARYSGRIALGCFVLAGACIALMAPARACGDTLDALVVGSAAADIWTTERALQQPGTVEANPMLQTPGTRIGAKAFGTVAILAGAKVLEHKGHKRASRVVKVVVILAWSGAAVNNIVVSRRAK